MSSKWTTEQIPGQQGRTALITGANSGIGFQAARALAAAGATVLLGCRDAERGKAAVEAIAAEVPGAELKLVELDLSSLASVEAAAAVVNARPAPLDLLINNAGVMAPPRSETIDGFELQFGTNHLGHFALTGRLLAKLLEAPAARVVTVSSTGHRMGTMDFDDLNWKNSYERWRAYGRSKLANLMFTFELDARLRAAGSKAIAVACHPGYAATNLQSAGVRLPGTGLPGLGRIYRGAMVVGNKLFAQSEEMGALPTLYAATAPDVVGGEYFGPDGRGEQRGHPTRVNSAGRSRKPEDLAQLWEHSERLTGVSFDALAA